MDASEVGMPCTLKVPYLNRPLSTKSRRPLPFPTGRVIVPTGRVIVATGRYVVPADISFDKKEPLLCLACDYTGYSPPLTGSKDLSSVGSNKCLKRTGRDNDGGLIILPPTTTGEHIAVQMESKARTTLLQSIPDDHVADFHYMDDAREIWNAVKARFGGNVKSKKMRKSMLKQEFSEFRIGEEEGLHKGSQDAGDAGEFALMGVTFERNSSKNLFKLIDSSMSVRTTVGLGFTNCISENELGWDDSAFSVFTTTSEDVKGRPTFHSDKSSEVNTNNFASSDSSVKSSEHQPNDSTSCAPTSSVSTSMNEAENDSTVGTPIKEPVSVQDLPSFTCNSFDKTEHTSRTSCNKIGSFNKKAGHFRKYASSVSKLCFVCGSSTHLIKDCDFYEKQMTNTTVRIGVGPAVRPQPVLTGKPKVTPVPTGKPKMSTPVPTGRPSRLSPFPTYRGFSPLVISGWWLSNARPMPHSINPTSSYFQTYIPYAPTMYYNHMKYGGDRWATPVKPSAVPTGRVIVPTGRYVVPTGRVIVATGRTPWCIKGGPRS
nr:xylulose kinase-1 [Tanacetum cinerariifolium]